MSSALAIAAVTAVLKDLLQNGIIDRKLTVTVGTDVKVSALPPNRIPSDTNEVSQLNLFMYHATFNQGWRNVGLPSRDSNGDRLSNPPLALDLHYLLTAYGAEDCNIVCAAKRQAVQYVRDAKSLATAPLHWNQEYSQGIIGAAIIVAAAIDQLSVTFRNRRLARIGKA